MVQTTEEKLLDAHMPIVFAVLRKIKVSGHLFDDAMQEGRVAAMLAIRSFRQESGARLSTWVYARVRWAICDWMGAETRAATGVSDRAVPTEPRYPAEPHEPREGLALDVRKALAKYPKATRRAAADIASGHRRSGYHHTLARALADV